LRNVAALGSATSVRTLMLGIDQAGRIVWHDRNAREMLDPPGGALLGIPLSDLVVGSVAGTLSGLLDAGRSEREATAVLTLRAQRSDPVEGVVTVQAIDGHDGCSAMAIVRMPAPSKERFLDPAVMRHALLDDTFRQIGATLDLDQMARGLIDIVVAHFSNVASLLVHESLVADEAPTQQKNGLHLLRRLAVASDDHDPGWEVTFPIGEVVRHPAGTIYAQCMDTGKPVQKASGGRAGHVAESWMRQPAVGLLSGACKLLLPLNARGATLGYIVCTRKHGSRPFDAYDTEIGMEFASRAAILLDNARRYNRERTTALTLQRSLLPTGLSAPSSVEVRQQMGEREPHFATCAYAIYDAVTGTMEVASAGHLPPLLVSPKGRGEFLDVSPAPPLGVGEGPISSRTFEIKDGSLFVLYTDGLVESRGRDIDDGLKQLQSVFGPTSVAEPIEALAKAALAGVSSDRHRDDVALLIARLARIDGDRQACWTLSGDLTSAREARRLVLKPLEKWGLGPFVPITQLLASELVTNAIRYAEGSLTLRLICDDKLVCEVADSSPALPRQWDAAEDDERGHGLQIVSRLAHRWGSRRTPTGKIVWCEQQIPLTGRGARVRV